jgi:hypothetical protein
MNSKRELLERPFPAELVRTRPGRNGEEIRFLEGHVVVARLNEAFGGDWSFHIEKHEIFGDEVIVLGKLSAGGIVKMAHGAWPITRGQATGTAVSFGDDLKAAATDSLKKAATLLGVGLHLYASMPPDFAQPATTPPQTPAPQPSNGNGNGNGKLSNAQLRAIHAIRKRLGWDDAKLASFVTSVAQVSDVEQLGKRAASVLIDRLKAEPELAEVAR